MGNECDGVSSREANQILRALEDHRKTVEDFERKMKEREALVSSKLQEVNRSRFQLEQERQEFDKTRRYSKIEQATTIPEENELVRSNVETYETDENVGKVQKKQSAPIQKNNKLCDFQFIVNYHFR